MLDGYINEENIKLLLIAGIYLILFTIEHYAPYFKKREHHLPHVLRNFTLASVNILVSTIFFILILKQVLDWTTDNQIGLLNQLNLPNTYSFLLAILLIDLWQYIWHRLNHQIPWLWKFHQVHHADKDMDASTGLRFHPVEIIYSNLIRTCIIPLVGLQIDHLLAYEILLLPIILFHHSNIRINELTDKILRLFIVTPHIHRLHHSDIQRETDSNYASVFSIWDRLFNSYTMRSIEHKFNLGLGDKFSEPRWNRVYGMLTLPFIK
ncbi:MAG: sterol desaturase family protein [Gammaproteobacteria bacterium]|nr:sterol desaturase family protein [Gammaproteobacteria bacterium]